MAVLKAPAAMRPLLGAKLRRLPTLAQHMAWEVVFSIRLADLYHLGILPVVSILGVLPRGSTLGILPLIRIVGVLSLWVLSLGILPLGAALMPRWV